MCVPGFKKANDVLLQTRLRFLINIFILKNAASAEKNHTVYQLRENQNDVNIKIYEYIYNDVICKFAE